MNVTFPYINSKNMNIRASKNSAGKMVVTGGNVSSNFCSYVRSVSLRYCIRKVNILTCLEKMG